MDFVMLKNHRPPRPPQTPVTVEQKFLEAIKHGSLSLVTDILHNGVDVNYKGDNCWTPLTLACRRGRTDVVSCLLQMCRREVTDVWPGEPCDTNLSNDSGDTPLICAARGGYSAIVELLLTSGANSNLANQYSSLTPLLTAIDNGHVATVAVLMSYDPDVQLTDNVKLTPLYTAIKLLDCDARNNITQQLIDGGCDVNIGSQDHAPIFLACRLGYLPIVEMLFDAHCDINVSNKYGVTPVYEAAIKGHNRVVQYLVSRDCVVDSPDLYGITPLHAAAIFNNPGAVHLLLKGGASVKMRAQDGRCAVLAAIEMGYAEVLTAFLAFGVDIIQPPKILRLSSLNKALEAGHIDTVRVLIQGCSSLPLFQCPAVLNCFRHDLDLVKFLLLSGMHGISNVFLRLRHPSCHLLDAHIVNWLKDFLTTPTSLCNIARVHIRRALGNQIMRQAYSLPLPPKLMDFVAMKL